MVALTKLWGSSCPQQVAQWRARVRVRCECHSSTSKWDCFPHDRINKFFLTKVQIGHNLQTQKRESPHNPISQT